MSKTIPLYGQNKDGGALGDFAEFINGTLKMVDYSTSQIAGNAGDVTLATASTYSSSFHTSSFNCCAVILFG